MTVSGQGLRHHAENRPSLLLSHEENQMVVALVGPRCQTLATTVAQVYRSEGPGHNYRWNKRTCGVICFVKDNLRRSYFIRVYDMDRTVLVFDQEIYNQFRYKAPRPYFHTFEGDDAQVGLNFADEAEAEIFQQTVESKLSERRNRRERRQASRKQPDGNGVHSNGAAKHAVQNGGGGDAGVKGVGVAPLQTVQINRRDQGGQSGKKVEKRKLKKEDIGMPSNFQHISHVGWDPNHGFDLENVDPNLKKFFHKAGVDEKALQDKDTRDFIYDFIDKHGGVEAALREVNSNGNSIDLSAAPPPPPRSLTNPGPPLSRPPPPSRIQASAPPPPPSSAPTSRSAPSHRAPPPPAPLVQQKPNNDVPAPPPPPPPPPSAPAPPPTSLLSQMSAVVSGPPPPPPSLPPIDNSHGSLMDEIKKGGSLRHVSPEKKSKAVPDSRGELMGQIRLGVALKKVDSDPGLDGPVVQQSAPGIAGMLQRALQERGMVMGMSSSEDEDSGEEDDEWDD